MALKNFWAYIHQNPERQGSMKANVALVVPRDLGFGFRNAFDTIWGADGDSLSQAIWVDTNKYINQYGDRVDIVYNDHEFIGSIKTHYTTVIELPTS